MRQFSAQNWLGVHYRKCLYGGWYREKDGQLAPPHKKAMAMHEASKALFCPICWGSVGQVGTSESETWTCERCEIDDITLWVGPHAAKMFSTIGVFGGNRSSKTFSGSSEYCSWLIGHRPWDGTLTAPMGKQRTRLIVCTSLTKSAEQVICPYIEERLDGYIDEKVKNSNKTVSYYVIKGTLDRLHIMSHEQYTKSSGTNPFEGPQFFDCWEDEPPPGGLRVAVQRGLTYGASQGWGREVFTGTPLHSQYVFDSMYQKAVANGGDRRDIFAINFSIWDNPGLTTADVEKFLDEVPPEEREAREHGRFLHMAGRIYPQFDASVHVLDPQEWDPLIERDAQGQEDGEPSDWPIIHTVDPHDRKPWAMGWYAVSPQGDMYAVREWPTEPYEKLGGRSNHGYDDYARVIAEVESTIPGGASRVLWREMDPNFGRRGTTADFGETIADAMRARGYFFRTDVVDKLADGHGKVRTLLAWDKDQPISQLNRPKLFFMANCRNHIWSIGVYTTKEWTDKDKAPDGKPKDPGKDHMDCLRYGVMRGPYYYPWREAHTDNADQARQSLAAAASTYNY